LEVVERGDLLEDILRATQADSLPMAEAVGAAVNATAAGQQNTLAAVIVRVAELALIVIEVDEIVGGKGQAVDLGFIRPLRCLPDKPVVAVKNAGHLVGCNATQQFNQNLFALALNGNLQLGDLVKESLLVSFDNGPTGDQRDPTMRPRQGGNALQLLKKECDGTEADHIRLKLAQNFQEESVVGTGQRRLDDPYLDTGKRCPNASGQIHETKWGDMHLVGHGCADPLIHVVAFHQQNSQGALSAMDQHGRLRS